MLNSHFRDSDDGNKAVKTEIKNADCKVGILILKRNLFDINFIRNDFPKRQKRSLKNIS